MNDESEELEFVVTSDGIMLPVQAQPKAKRPGITGIHAGRLKVAVAEPPEQGKANAAIIRLLAKALGLKRQQIEMTAGATSSQKRVLITGITGNTLQQRIEEILAETRKLG